MSWRTVTLGELVDNFSVRAKDHDSDTSELEFCGVSNDEGITKSKYAAEDKAEDYKIIEKDCFAYNPYRINVGSIGLLEDDTVGLISPAYVVFKPKPKRIIPQLLLKFLKSAEGLRQIKLYARGTVRQALRFEDLCKIELAIPDYEEQLDFFKRIEETEIESKEISTELTHQLDLVKQLRQAFLREAMQGKLVPQDPYDEPASVLLEKIKAEKELLIKEKKIKKPKPLPPINEDEIPFEIPEGWVWCRLGELCEIKGGKRVPAGYKLSRKETPYIYIRVSDMQNGTIIDSDLHYIEEHIYQKIKNYTISKDDIYMTIVGATIGKCGLVPERFDGCNLTENAVKIEPYSISKEFLWQLLQMPFAQAQFIDKTKKVGVEKMAIFRFKSTILPLPPLSEQQRIVRHLDELMQYCDGLEASIKESQQQNELLLQQVLREALEPKEKEVERV